MRDLIAKLEKLEGPVDAFKAACIANDFLPWDIGTKEWNLFIGSLRGFLDDAIELFERVLPGWRGDVDTGCPVSRGDAIGVRLFPPGPGWENFEGEGATPSIALIIALLRAKEEQDG